MLRELHYAELETEGPNSLDWFFLLTGTGQRINGGCSLLAPASCSPAATWTLRKRPIHSDSTAEQLKPATRKCLTELQCSRTAAIERD